MHHATAFRERRAFVHIPRGRMPLDACSRPLDAYPHPTVHAPAAATSRAAPHATPHSPTQHPRPHAVFPAPTPPQDSLIRSRQSVATAEPADLFQLAASTQGGTAQLPDYTKVPRAPQGCSRLHLRSHAHGALRATYTGRAGGAVAIGALSG